MFPFSTRLTRQLAATNDALRHQIRRLREENERLLATRTRLSRAGAVALGHLVADVCALKGDLGKLEASLPASDELRRATLRCRALERQVRGLCQQTGPDGGATVRGEAETIRDRAGAGAIPRPTLAASGSRRASSSSRPRAGWVQPPDGVTARAGLGADATVVDLGAADRPAPRMDAGRRSERRATSSGLVGRKRPRSHQTAELGPPELSQGGSG